MDRTKQVARKGLAISTTSQAPPRLPDAPPLILELADVLWVQIFCFVGSPIDFSSLELTCKSFQRMFEHDTLWKACFGEEVKYTDGHYQDMYEENYNRDEAFIGIVCDRVSERQRSTENILLDVYGQAWKQNVERILNQEDTIIYENFPAPPETAGTPHRFVLRGDAAHVLACLVEENMLELLRRALLIAIRSSNRSESYSILPQDVQAVRRTMFPDAPYCSARSWYCHHWDDDNLIRRLTFRAGITKIHYHSYEEIFETLISISFQLAFPACLELVSRATPHPTTTTTTTTTTTEERPRMVLEAGMSMRDVSPYPKLALDDDEGTTLYWEHIIVPRQIEDAATRSRLFCTKVYGNEWFAATTTDEAQERDASYNMYANNNTDGGLAVDMDAVSLYDEESSDDEGYDDDDDDTSMKDDAEYRDRRIMRKLRAYLFNEEGDWFEQAEKRSNVQARFALQPDQLKDYVQKIRSGEDSESLSSDEFMSEEENSRYDWEELKGIYAARKPLTRQHEFEYLQWQREPIGTDREAVAANDDDS